MATDEVQSDLKYKSCRKGRKRFRPVIKNLSEYTANTTIHGIKYLGWKNRPLAEKIYWVIIFMICLALLAFFMREIMLKWGHKFVILVEDDTPTPIHKIPFPAVTICPQYKLRKTEFSYGNFFKMYPHRHNNTAYSDYFMRYQVAQQVCSFKSVSIMADQLEYKYEFLNESHVALLLELSPGFEDIYNGEMESNCKIKLSTLNLSFTTHPITVDTFSTVLTNEGKCFTFNLHPNVIRSENVQNDYSYIYSSANNKGLCTTSEVSRIKINLDTNKSAMDLLCQPTYPGYKVILHSPEIYPTTFENYIAIYHESTTRIKVQPLMITTSETLRSYTPKQRQCYFIGERQLKFFKFYNRANCKLECFANYTLQTYGCVHYAIPRAPGVPICGELINYSELYELVDGLDSLLNYLQDYPDRNDDVEFRNVKEFRSCDCLSECNSIDYDYTTIAESFNFEKMLLEIGMVWNKTGVEAPVEFEIFWESPKFKGTLRKQLYTFTDLVSHFGGLLGLFMGASILSIFEIIYFCVVRNFTKN